MNAYEQFYQRIAAHSHMLTADSPQDAWNTLAVSAVWEQARRISIARFAWAIPNDTALATIAAHAPIVEIGAGKGYWASLLRVRGVAIVAYDCTPPEQPWTEVQRGDEAVLPRYPLHTLLLCWPPGDDPMALHCLRNYSGEVIITVGDGPGGCTGDAAFHAVLARDWQEVTRVAIPQWPPYQDYLAVWRRGGVSQMP